MGEDQSTNLFFRDDYTPPPIASRGDTEIDAEVEGGDTAEPEDDKASHQTSLE